MIREVEHDKDDHEHNRQHEREPRFCPRLVLILAAPLRVVSERQLVRVDRPFGFVDEAADIPAPDAECDQASQQPVLARDHGWAGHRMNTGELRKRDLRSTGRRNKQPAQFRGAGAKLRRIPDAYWEPLAPLDSDRDIAFADALVHYLLYRRYVYAVPGRRLSVDFDVYVGSAGDLLRIDVRSAG